jgi:ABC-type hemin transport system substrate-binding protein
MDTTLFCRHQPGGSFSVVARRLFPEGEILWVNSATGTDGPGHGRDPDGPFASLVYAETQAGTGDTIFVMPGHTETLASASSAVVLTLDVTGLQVVGLGNRSRKPAFLIDGHEGNYVSITGADTVLRNLVFLAGHANIVSGILVAAAGVEFQGCEFLQNAAFENFLFSIETTSGGDSLVVEGCRFVSIDTAADAAIHLVGACNNVRIRGNYFDAPYVTSAIEAITNPCLDILIANNVIRNVVEGDDLAGAIDLVASSTGMIVDNRIYLADDTDILTCIDGANCGKAGNVASNEFSQEAGVAGTQAA